MTEDLKKYERTIKKKHSFGWTPKYEEDFRTGLNKTTFFPIAKEVIENLGWKLVYDGESSIETEKSAEAFHWGQRIIIKYEFGKVKVSSKSLGNEMWDFGRNSVRVKLFIHAFKTLEKSYDKEALVELEEKEMRANNWDDYIIPESLPQPDKQTKSKPWMPIVGGIMLAIILGFSLAYLTINVGYIIGLFELGVGLLAGFGFKFLIQKSNYTNFDHLSKMAIVTVVVTYILNQYFLYYLLLEKNYIGQFYFWDFLQLRFREGLTIESIDTGWIGLVISWLFQIGFSSAIAYTRVATHLTQYQLERVPMEVVNFAFYHFLKGKTEQEVRQKLFQKGWTNKEDQNNVFVSIGIIQSLQESNKTE
jgi:hypothetical protein